MMKRMITVALLAIVLGVAIPIGNAHIVRADGELSHVELSRELILIEAYITYSDSTDGEYSVESLDADAALANGISQGTIELAKQMVDYNNDLARLVHSSGISDITQLDIDFSDYPKIEEYIRGRPKETDGATGDSDDPDDP